MKGSYEKRTRYYLPRRTNTLIRIDGKTFNTYTRSLEKPFDQGLIEDMRDTAIYLCENIQGAKCAYVQSDEISLLLTDYDSLQTDAYFDGAIDKICSISASYATAKFNQLRTIRAFYAGGVEEGVRDFYENDPPGLIGSLTLAQFDARCFTIPEKEEVVNYFIWRQRDAERNSIQSLAQSLYSQRELMNKNTSDLQDLCWQKGQNWNDLAAEKKRGTFIVKQEYTLEVKTLFGTQSTLRTKWESIETPQFSKSREAILNLMP